MSPQASKNIRVIAGLFFLFTTLAIIMMPIDYINSKNRLEKSRRTDVEILAYGRMQTPGKTGGRYTQFLDVQYANPFTGKIVTSTTNIHGDKKYLEEKIKNLPVGTVTSSFYYPYDDHPVIASIFENSELPQPGANTPFLMGAAAVLGSIGLGLWRLGKRV